MYTKSLLTVLKILYPSTQTCSRMSFSTFFFLPSSSSLLGVRTVHKDGDSCFIVSNKSLKPPSLTERFTAELRLKSQSHKATVIERGCYLFRCKSIFTPCMSQHLFCYHTFTSDESSFHPRLQPLKVGMIL